MKGLLFIPIFCLTITFNISAQTTPQEMLNKAIYEEEVNGNLDEAIKLFLEIVDKNPTNRAVTVEAFYHLGLTNEKLGNKKAKEYYEKIVNSFGDQPEFVRIANERLSRLIKFASNNAKTELKPKFRKVNCPIKLSWVMQLSPDGKKVIFASASDGKLWIMPLSGKLGPEFPGIPEKINTDNVEADWSGLAWSGDSKWIAFNGGMQNKKEQKRDGNQDIYIVPADGGKPKQLTKTPESFINAFPCWSTDGKSIAYVHAKADKVYSTGFNELNIYSVPVDGGDPKVLTSDSDSVKFAPIACSPDGKFVAYFSTVKDDTKAGILKILSVNDRVSKVVKKIQVAHTHIELAWSPDSKSIAFIYGTETYGKNIRVISINDGSTKDIETGLENINMYQLDWSPDGDRFVFSGFQGDRPELWFMEDFLPKEETSNK